MLSIQGSPGGRGRWRGLRRSHQSLEVGHVDHDHAGHADDADLAGGHADNHAGDADNGDFL